MLCGAGQLPSQRLPGWVHYREHGSMCTPRPGLGKQPGRPVYIAQTAPLSALVPCMPASASAGTVHSGFLKQLDALVSKADGGNTITQVVGRLSGGRPVGRVICTGHSLGAALATLGELASAGVGVGV